MTIISNFRVVCGLGGIFLVSLLLVGCLGGGGSNLFTVRGSVVDTSGEGLAGVTIQFDGGHTSVLTNDAGEWVKAGLSGSVTVTPDKEGYMFEPVVWPPITGRANGVNFTAFVSTTVVDLAEFKDALADAAVDIILPDGILTIDESGTIDGNGKTIVGDIVIASGIGLTITDLEIRGTVTIGTPVGSSSDEVVTLGGQPNAFHFIGVTIVGDLVVNYDPSAFIAFYDTTVQGSADVWSTHFVTFHGYSAAFYQAITVHSGTLYLYGTIDVPLPTLQMLWPDGDPLEQYIANDFAARIVSTVTGISRGRDAAIAVLDGLPTITSTRWTWTDTVDGTFVQIFAEVKQDGDFEWQFIEGPVRGWFLADDSQGMRGVIKGIPVEGGLTVTGSWDVTSATDGELHLMASGANYLSIAIPGYTHPDGEARITDASFVMTASETTMSMGGEFRLPGESSFQATDFIGSWNAGGQGEWVAYKAGTTEHLDIDKTLGVWPPAAGGQTTH